ncbi:MAG: hypothetical protein AAGI34_20325 [Pseudomonadota bacterium]
MTVRNLGTAAELTGSLFVNTFGQAGDAGGTGGNRGRSDGRGGAGGDIVFESDTGAGWVANSHGTSSATFNLLSQADDGGRSGGSVVYDGDPGGTGGSGGTITVDAGHSFDISV